jgi:hypothetical protein
MQQKAEIFVENFLFAESSRFLVSVILLVKYYVKRLSILVWSRHCRLRLCASKTEFLFQISTLGLVKLRICSVSRFDASENFDFVVQTELVKVISGK